jgi:hypothetical protein
MAVVRCHPPGLVHDAGVPADVHQPLAPIQVRVLARPSWRRIASPAVPRRDELPEPPHRHQVLVEAKAAHARRIGLAGRSTIRSQHHSAARAERIVRPVVRPARDLGARAAALAVCAASGQARAAHPAARRKARIAVARLGAGGCVCYHDIIARRVCRGVCRHGISTRPAAARVPPVAGAPVAAGLIRTPAARRPVWAAPVIGGRFAGLAARATATNHQSGRGESERTRDAMSHAAQLSRLRARRLGPVLCGNCGSMCAAPCRS